MMNMKMTMMKIKMKMIMMKKVTLRNKGIIHGLYCFLCDVTMLTPRHSAMDSFGSTRRRSDGSETGGSQVQSTGISWESMGKPWENHRKMEVYPLVNQHNYGRSSFSTGKLTISMAMFNSYVKLPEGRDTHTHTHTCKYVYIYIYIYINIYTPYTWNVSWKYL